MPSPTLNTCLTCGCCVTGPCMVGGCEFRAPPENGPHRHDTGGAGGDGSFHEHPHSAEAQHDHA